MQSKIGLTTGTMAVGEAVGEVVGGAVCGVLEGGVGAVGGVCATGAAGDCGGFGTKRSSMRLSFRCTR